LKEAGGYVTQAKFVVGRTPEQMEAILGLQRGELKEGAYVMTIESPQVDQFELRSYTNLPDGKVFVPGVSDPRWLPALGAPQWQISKGVLVRATGSKFVAPGAVLAP
jgi:hypothetical protein